ncbi:MAG: GAF domain-containing protein [Clostridia bacterium]
MSSEPTRAPSLAPLTRGGYWFAYIGPAAALTALGIVDRGILVHYWPESRTDPFLFLVAIVLTLLYSHVFLRRIKVVSAQSAELLNTTQAQRDRLRFLHEAMLSIAGERDWEVILTRVVELSREITGARYGALAVLNADGGIARFITVGLTDEQKSAIASLPRGVGLLGEVMRKRQTLRIDNITAHPSAAGFPPGHPAMTTFLGVPAVFGSQVVAHLYLTDKEGGPFTADDEDVVSLIAGQAAVLVTNARLNREVERLAVVEERQRIGMDLHDGTIQSLYGVTLAIDTLLPKIPPELTDVRRVLDELGDRLSRITTDIRHYIFDLRQNRDDWPTVVSRIADELGISSIVRVEAADAGYRHLSAGAAEQVEGWIREALTNVARHAAASSVRVMWRSDGGSFRVTVDDNGVGFDPNTASVAGHYGLMDLRERARSLGGRFDLKTAPQGGTHVTLEAQLDSEATP